MLFYENQSILQILGNKSAISFPTLPIFRLLGNKNATLFPKITK